MIDLYPSFTIVKLKYLIYKHFFKKLYYNIENFFCNILY